MMTRIEPEQWLPSTFARALKLIDITRFPSAVYEELSEPGKAEMRQSQVEANEVIRVLGFYEKHALIMKSDRVIGWVAQETLRMDEQIRTFDPVRLMKISAKDFFASWNGAPYLWGGITRAGIDCSGLVQRYFRDVLERTIPKNTFDQRRSGTSKNLADLANNDLIFCTRVGGRGTHHAGIYIDGVIWYANRERGVMCQKLADFLQEYQVLEVVTLI